MPVNSLRLCRLISDAHASDNLHDVYDAYREWQSAHCYHPQKQRVYDAHTGEYRVIEVPCGKCYHCRESHINEWVTRMYAHCEDFKHVYFVTLTYRSYHQSLPAAHRLCMNKLVQACWHLDSYNETKRLCYSPSLLIKKHYQDFLKRLRKYSGCSDLTYVMSGEYGKQYGRPHFHFILFSNSPIQYKDVQRAWSIALHRDAAHNWSYKTSQKSGQTYYYPIGRVDFNDLVTNGTMNTAAKVKVDGQFMSAAKCFSYVCKYVCKQDNYNSFRVKVAYNSLYDTQKVVSIWNTEVVASQVARWLQEHNISYTAESLFNLKRHTYVKVIKRLSPQLYSEGISYSSTKAIFDPSFVKELCPSLEVVGNKLVIDYFPKDYYQFNDVFQPFVEFSRGTPIGSLYAKTHLHEFVQGVFNKPILQDKSYVLPKYFFNKAAEYLYGLRSVSQTAKGVSYSFGSLQSLRGHLQSLSSNISPEYFCDPDSQNVHSVEALVHSSLSMYDKSTGEHITFPVEDPWTIRVDCYKYDRHTRDYYLTRSFSLHQWLDYWLDRLDCEFVRYRSNRQLQQESVRLKDRAFLLATDLGFDLQVSKESFIAQQDQYLHQKQQIYDEFHKNAE